MPAPVRVSRTQEERREQTRGAILDATVSSLVENGYSKTTTSEVQKRAGVSRGALLHHFPNKADLLASAVRHLSQLRGVELNRMASLLPEGSARVDAVIDLLWESFNGPLFQVAMELRNAARTDPELREVIAGVELELRTRILNQSRRLFGEPVASAPGFECAMDISLQLMMGAAMSSILHEDARRLHHLFNKWKTLFPQLLEAGPPTPLMAPASTKGETT